ncbi:hypothetical protein [Undibacterium sp. RuRC25W]|uniref:hypothetical protein n=1 Tax=Undibacterium sp. RuRC25W TaxID=3413047 RepID=UPI003BF1B82A
MSITIHEALRAYIDPLTEHEYEALERSILTEGCRDALVCWGEVLIDGHNRYVICQKHQIPFKVVQNDNFSNIEDVQLWMIDNHLARRSVSDFQRGMLALRKKEIITTRLKLHEEAIPAASSESDIAVPIIKPTQSRQEIARVAGISSNAVVQIEKIQRTASPALVQAVRDGTISISAAAAVASLPNEEQIAAVAGGRKELQQAARQIREKIREQKAPFKKVKAAELNNEEGAESATNHHTANDDNATTGNDNSATDTRILQQKIIALQSENAILLEKIATLQAALDQAQSAI